MVFILCCIILTKFFIIKFFQFFKTLLIPVPIPHHFLLVTIYCNSRIIQINEFEQHSLAMPFNSDYHDIGGNYIFCWFDLLWKSFQGFTLWSPTKAPTWIFCGAYSTLRTSSAFYNIQKLNFTSKMDIGKTVWINPCYENIDTQLEGFYHWRKTSMKNFPYEK